MIGAVGLVALIGLVVLVCLVAGSAITGVYRSRLPPIVVWLGWSGHSLKFLAVWRVVGFTVLTTSQRNVVGLVWLQARWLLQFT